MTVLRLIIRLGLVATVTLVSALGLIVSTALIGWLGWQVRARLRLFFVQTWAKSALKIIGVRLNVSGEPPDPPFFLVSNHLSYLDITVYFSFLRGVFVAKSDVGSWPLIGFLSKLANTLFIDRRRRRDLLRVNSLMARNVNPIQGIILFPEGTSTAGNRVLRLKPSLLDMPAQRQLPVHFATISYRTDELGKPAHLGVCWWGDMTFAGHFLKLLQIRRIHADVVFGRYTVTRRDRKELAEALWEGMTAQFQPVWKKP